MTDAIISDCLNEVSFCVIYFLRVDGEPLQERLLHNVFRIGFASNDVVRDRGERWLIKRDSLGPVHSDKGTEKPGFLD